MLKNFRNLRLFGKYCELYLLKILSQFSSFAREHYPFKLYFMTLLFFEVDDVYRKKLTKQKLKNPWLTEDIVVEVKKQSWEQYQDDLENQEKETREKTEMTRLLGEKIKLKLDALKALLVLLASKEILSSEEALRHGDEIDKLIDPEDLHKSFDDIIKYADYLIEKYKQYIQ